MARPRGFNPDAAVETAMMLFWRQGYDSVSFESLVQEAGASRKGLYALWPDKRALLVAALQRYRQVVGDHFLSHLERVGAGLSDVEEFWNMFETAAREPGWRGCLMMRTASSRIADEPDVASEIKAHLDRLLSGFENALRGAAERREVAANFSPQIAANQAFAVAAACSAIGIFEGFSPRVAGLIGAGRAASGLSSGKRISSASIE
jgi:TetR/AcrR family transcriptional repressor of nem operon